MDAESPPCCPESGEFSAGCPGLKSVTIVRLEHGLQYAYALSS